VLLSDKFVGAYRCWYAYTKELYYWIIEGPRVLIIIVCNSNAISCLVYNVFGGTLNLAQSINHVSLVTPGLR